MIWNTCPACTCSAISFAVEIRQRVIYLCETCGHKFVREPMSQKSLVERYQGMAYFHENCGHQGIQAIEDDAQWQRFETGRFGKVAGLGLVPQPVPAGFRVLEIGCLEGRVLRKLAEQGCHVTGLEVNAAVAERGRMAFGIDIVTTAAEDWNYPADTFDAVLSFHTFEHLIDPAIVAERTCHTLNPGARALIEVPADDDEL
ncbi:MAG TPA: class I SAM-dependent methyltransferase, partial [Azospirillaceae bacterium]|nr:class I SAM-dependent methyltransferase [Azospirillaceae bacterium]